MTTVARSTKIVHYAYFGDAYGTAELVCGSGYLFRKDGERTATLVPYTHPELMVLGHVPTADQQWTTDQGRGGLVHTCSRTTQERYYPETDDVPDMQRW